MLLQYLDSSTASTYPMFQAVRIRGMVKTDDPEAPFSYVCSRATYQEWREHRKLCREVHARISFNSACARQILNARRAARLREKRAARHHRRNIAYIAQVASRSRRA